MECGVMLSRPKRRRRCLRRCGACRSSNCCERMFVVHRLLWYPRRPTSTESAMEEQRSEEIGERRVSLLVQIGDSYAVTIEVRGPAGWEDISLRADQELAFEVASWRYRQRVAEQQARAIEWNQG